jgi:glutamate N-acetyltransferase/amino-acid N-acetyltransferase
MAKEGATKFITLTIEGAKTNIDADKIAKTIATSPLVKTAVFGNDIGWGRIMAAIGRSGVKTNQEKIDITMNKCKIVKNGIADNTQIKKIIPSLKNKNRDIIVKIGLGKAKRTVYTSDLSYEYVKINADYHTNIINANY